MPPKEGRVVLRASLDESLIIELKVAAVKGKVQPNAIVEAALKLYLSDPANLEALKRSK